MTIDGYPRLCGGTFFTLVIQAHRQRMKAREHYDGDCDGLSDPEFLVGLIKVINPDYEDPGKEVLSGTANNYKACKTSKSTYLPFDDEQVISAFDKTVRENYPAALNRMIAFIDRFIDTGRSARKDVVLVRALIDLIQQDSSITEETEFYIGRTGEKTKKAALGDLDEVCLPSFLLGVWHYIAVNRKKNSVGKQTYDRWCPSQGGAQREYTAHMGEGILEDIKVYLIEAEETSETGTVVEPPREEEAKSGSSESTAQVTQQVINNNPTFFNFNITGSNNNVYNHVDKVVAGGNKDE